MSQPPALLHLALGHGATRTIPAWGLGGAGQRAAPPGGHQVWHHAQPTSAVREPHSPQGELGLSPGGAGAGAHQEVNGAAHAVGFVLVIHHSPVVKEPLQEPGHQRDEVLPGLGQLWVSPAAAEQAGEEQRSRLSLHAQLRNALTTAPAQLPMAQGVGEGVSPPQKGTKSNTWAAMKASLMLPPTRHSRDGGDTPQLQPPM